MRYILSLSLLTLVSCASMKQKGKSSEASVSTSIKGTLWTVTRIPGFEMEKTRKPVTLYLSDTAARFSGNGGCNGYGGEYILNGDSLKLGEVLATMMACKPGSHTENKYFTVLRETNRYEISGDKMLLKNGKTTLAELTRSKKD